MTPEERHALLHHADEGHVLTSEHDNQVYLVLPGQAPVMISAKAEQMADLGLLREPAASLRWELTPAGRELLRGAS
jgi:Tfp pilus assembly protein FimV